MQSIQRTSSKLAGAAAIAWLAMAGSPALRAQPWITGYYSAGNGVLPVSQIPWAKYTHVIHFAASTDGNGNMIPYYLQQSEINQITQSHPPTTKVLVCLKDNDNNYNYFGQSTSSSLLSQFVTSIVNFVTSNGYDGVDIDWEKNVNAAQFESLLTQLHAAMPSKLITMAGNPGNSKVAGASNASLNQVNVMCYDLDWGSSFSWYVDPLLQSGNSNVLTCDWDVAYFTGAGVPKNKIGIGMPYYGRRWPGVTQAQETANFNNAVTFLYRDLVTDTTRWQSQYQHYDNVYQANYLSINTSSLTEFDSYTGPQFIQEASHWQQNNGFGGFMTYTIDYEYLVSQSCDAAFPLSTVLYTGANPTLGSAVLTTLTATAGNGSVALSWNSCAGSGGSYEVFRNSGPGTSFTAIAQNLTGSSYTDSSVSGGTTYSYYIAASNSSGGKGNSSLATATPSGSSSGSQPPPPPSTLQPPTGLTGSSPATGEIRISWKAASGATSADTYEIWRSTVSGGPYKYIDTTADTKTTYLNLGMGSGTTYCYVVTTDGNGSQSAYSNQACVKSK